jgi:hypothetical protein
MSAYSTNETQFKDPKLLCAALAELGFDASMVESHDTAQNLIDYHGKPRPDRAEIIIRRRFIDSASNDIGFKLGANGTYGAIISDYDRNHMEYNGAWLGKLSAAYARQGIIQKAQRQGLRVAGTVKKDGKTQLIFVKG